MDNEISPQDFVDNCSNSPSPPRFSQSPDMAAVVANLPQPLFQPPTSSPTTTSQSVPGATKRYRPAPAKTFQCRGYGECRMVFSRSEHLARHIRYVFSPFPCFLHPLVTIAFAFISFALTTCFMRLAGPTLCTGDALLSTLALPAAGVPSTSLSCRRRAAHALAVFERFLLPAMGNRLRSLTKHTGERPFSCHCGKQFSRLDNLRQHAQTVHADKADQNERMMHELTSLHATMTAVGKGAPRGKRSQNAHAANATSVNSGSSGLDGTLPSMNIKQEDLPMSMRPGTSTGYEGDDDFFRSSANWTDSRHSFRDPGQSFRVPPASSTAAAHLHHGHTQHASQSFLAPASTPFSFSLPDIGNTPGSASRPGTSSRPPTSSGGSSDRSLPPISAIVAASGAPSLPVSSAAHQLPYPPLVVPQQREQSRASLTSSYVLPLPTPSGPYAGYRDRRPSTATRPGTAPASYYYGHGPTLPPLVGARPELSLSLATGHGRRGPDRLSDVGSGGYEPASPAGPYGDSPFSFHAPASSTPSSATFPSERERDAPPAVSNPRKRPYAGSDDDEHDGGGGERSDDRYGSYREPRDVRPYSSGRRPGTSGYEYGSESRPQSRRLSVMELCNDADAEPAARPALSLSGGASRPTTSSGIITGAQQLALYDRTPSPAAGPAPAAVAAGPFDAERRGGHAPVHAGAAPAAGGADAPYPAAASTATATGGEGAARIGGGAIPDAYVRGVSPVFVREHEQRGQRTPQSPASPPAAGAPSASAATGPGGSPLARTHVLRGSPPVSVRWGHGGTGTPGRGPGSPGAGYGWAGVRSPAGSGSPNVSPRGRSPASVGSPSGVSLGMRA
ncbi:uncharacterized protein PHACADRAFT_122474 [Phanerochaete carnosa HHB-10118-sp]|uniref:C2H2-type domain-containing protein n=1 Tax=Phanerochaete carnosa (strain HHB-10118-sp) TaxID=650164 RepID=K5X0D7_PHACS|nr:uncharacterized protein PHACADRAFT_122474 [Phanerochaete carnosa HHB-10118-sp]EKM56227.1 hypothetical protein PHACADRAFT_122474 [Phanerochaete carnosa HHB-10118-sp]